MIKSPRIGHEIVRRLKTESTNTLALTLASEGETSSSHGTVIVADSQSNGRGRLGRGWVSPEGLNIYMSVILRAEHTPALTQSPGLLPLMAGLAAIKAIKENADLKGISLKWPNDIMVNNKKLGGILLEARTKATQDASYAVIGMGINVNSTVNDFPAELRDIATSVLIETGSELSLETLLKSLMEQLETAITLTHTKEGRDTMLAKYREACSTLNSEVIATMTNEAVKGQAVDIDELGRLLIRSPEGTQAISSADITHLR